MQWDPTMYANSISALHSHSRDARVSGAIAVLYCSHWYSAPWGSRAEGSNIILDESAENSRFISSNVFKLEWFSVWKKMGSTTWLFLLTRSDVQSMQCLIANDTWVGRRRPEDVEGWGGRRRRRKKEGRVKCITMAIFCFLETFVKYCGSKA